MTRLYPLLPFLLLAIVSSAIAFYLFPLADTDGGVATGVTASELEARSSLILDELGIDRSTMHSRVTFKADRGLLRQVQGTAGLERGNRLVRTSIPGYTWTVRWTKDTPVRFSMGGSDDKSEEVEKAVSWLLGDVSFTYDQAGRLLSFQRSIPDSVSLPNISPDSAVNAAREFFHSHSYALEILTGRSVLDLFGDTSTAPRRTEQSHRTDFTYSWKLVDTTLKNTVNVSYTVSGSYLSQAGIAVEVPEEFTSTSASSIHGIYAASLYVATIIVLAVVTFKRFRAYEIGFRLALIVGTITGLILGIRLYISLAGEMGFEILFPVLFGPLFFGGGLVLVWGAAESAVRESWRDKIVSLDLLANGYILHSRIGSSILRGTALGLASLALTLAAAYAIGQWTNLGISFGDEDGYQFLSSPTPLLSSMMEAFYGHTYTLAFFLMFLGSRLFRRTSSFPLSAGAVILVLASLRALQYEPVWAGALLSIAASSVVVFAFFRYDILTSFLAMVTGSLGHNALMMQAGGGELLQSSAGIVSVLILLLVTGSLSQFRRRELTDFETITPAFAKHITERERLQHELAIARQVQMSFLPKKNPVVSTLDIASRCSPALEVGGDYYDFIELPENRLAVVVGDVSGKGTQAAFFMTLTKGFLRALAQVSSSPGTILNAVNRLFYENVERGVFISLICGVFDTSKSDLTIARAGHNPVILRKSRMKDTQVLNPMGLALGLDQGEVFERSVKEVAVSYDPGDVFVFYTDGVSEAMNPGLEEFGEDRLAQSVELHAHKDASGILEGIMTDVQRFVGKAKQHDDVTLVVVRIVRQGAEKGDANLTNL